jgi:general nucleoside transport system permease protein
MSVASPGTPAVGAVPAVRLRLTRRGVLALSLAGLALFSLVRVVSGAEGLTTVGTTTAALGAAVPIGMAGLGALWAERAGVVNIGLEGMMILGTWGGGWAGYQWGPWWGLLAGVIGGALGGLLHAVATVTFGVDHIISGVAVNLLGPAAATYLSVLAFEGVPGGGPTQSPRIPTPDPITVPGLSDALVSLSNQRWFLISDVAGILGGLVTNLSPLTVLAILMLPLSFFMLWRTAFGLRLRSCGENPVAAESLGVNVYFHKYAAVIVSGAFAGFGGAFLAIVAARIYREGQTGGRGFIGLAAMIFGNWRPSGLAGGAGLFGYTDALQLRGGGSVHALLLFLAIVLGLVAGVSVLRRRWIAAGISAVLGAGSLVYYLLIDAVPTQLAFAAPYVVTLLVLALATQRLRMPAADGRPYRRGEEQ